MIIMTHIITTISIGSILLSSIALADSATSSAPSIAARLQHYVDENVIAGAVVLVADKDRIMDIEAFGYSDLATRRKMQPDDLFWIASMTKPMTAAALMMLVDEGKLSVDDPVARYIPAFANLKVQQADGTLAELHHPILIREILSHTAGLRFLNSQDLYKIDKVPLETSIQHNLTEPLIYQPGAKYQYSNEGIDTAGRIIEIVSGMPYEKFLQERFFKPLGMIDTTFVPNAEQLKRLARIYQSSPDKKTLEEKPTSQLTYPLDASSRYPSPAGGLFSTARDVSRFCQMLAAGGTFEGKKYLSKESIRMMTTKRTPADVNDRYGFGTGIGGDNGTSFGHGGAVKTNMWIEGGMIRIFMVQHDGDWASGNPSSDFEAEARRLFGSGQAASDAPTNTVGTQAPVR